MAATSPESGSQVPEKQDFVTVTGTDANDGSSRELEAEPAQESAVTWQLRLLNAAERYWLFEFFGLALALLSLIGVIIVVSVTDGKKVPDWTLKIPTIGETKEYPVTINTILSIFATVFNSALLLPVAACMSQLKWAWFQKSHRPLAEYQTFESAARGPVGSIILLWTLRCRRLACLGAVVIIAALGIGFSFQALVVYPLRPNWVDDAKIERTNFHYGSTKYGIIDDWMVGAIYSGAFRWRQPVNMHVSCGTGNCTFNTTYTSMGICGQCFNVTDSLIKTCATASNGTRNSTGTPESDVDAPYCNYTLPNGLQLSGISSANISIIEASSAHENSINFNDSATISVFSTIQRNWRPYRKSNESDLPVVYVDEVEDWEDPTQPGHESWNPPAGSDNWDSDQWDQYYNSLPSINYIYADTVVNSYEDEDEDDEGIMPTQEDLEAVQALECGMHYCVQRFNTSVRYGTLYEKQLGHFTDGSFDQDGDYVLQPPPSFTNRTDNNTFRSNSFQLMKEYFDDFWQASVHFNTSSWEADFDTQLARLLFDGEFQMEVMWARLAQSMSYANRRDSQGYKHDADDMVFANGAMYEYVPFVKVRWAWITWPVTLLLMATVLLVGTIYVSWRDNTVLWKGSSLAAFTHPLAGDAGEKVSELTSPTQAIWVAKNLDVKFERTERGYRLMKTNTGEA